MYQAVIVDFDGTLLDSYQYAFKRLDLLAAQNGLIITAETRQRMLKAWGRTGIEFLQDIFDISRKRATQIYQEWEAIDIENQIPFIPGTHTTLEWLRKKNIVVCMLTSRHRVSVMSILSRHNLQNYFARITAREDSNFSKPDKRAFTGILQTLTRQNVSRGECLFVGDTLADIEAGQNADIRTVVVETGPYREEHYKTHPVPEDHVIPSIAALPSWIQSV